MKAERAPVIPGDDKVARLLREGEITWNETKTQFMPSLHAFHDPNLSVDWLAKTTLEDSYCRLGKSVAHVVFCVMDLRNLEQRVEHDPTDENPAHSLVIDPPQMKKRSNYLLLRFVQLAKVGVLRPRVNTNVSPTKVDSQTEVKDTANRSEHERF